MTCREMTQFEKIKQRVNSRPGDSTFSPSYMYRDTHEDATYMIERIEKLEGALEGIAQCCGHCPEHLGADNYKDPGIKMAQEIIESMREWARKALK